MYNIEDIKNKIICGNALEKLKLISDSSIDLIIADPPYYKVLNEKWDNQWNNANEYLMWNKEWTEQCYRVLKLVGSIYIFGDLLINAFLKTIFYCEDIGLIKKSIIIWCKDKAMVNVKRNYLHDIEAIAFFVKSSNYIFNQQKVDYQKEVSYYRYKKADFDNDGIITYLDLKNANELFKYNQMKNQFGNKFSEDTIFLDITKPHRLCKDYFVDISSTHEKAKGQMKDLFSIAVKPKKLIARLILTSSCETNLILDPFFGSGTTGVVCKELNRNFIGIEINPEYCKLARERINNLEAVSK